ncbi:MAG: hypothetical protein LH491_08520, partial [Pseudoxanthomonas sp.]|nr:hypothetical protein [Pseudoxanthomonas sp.]
MRQVFTSIRVETVEGVARLLEDAGIEVHILNGRSYHSKRSGQFSYAEPMKVKQQPSVWIKKAEDQPQARELLRQAGLLASTRADQDRHYLFARDDAPDHAARERSWTWRIRIGLILAIAVASMFTLYGHRNMQNAASVTVAAPEAGAGAGTGTGTGAEAEEET